MFSAEFSDKLARRRQIERHLQEALQAEGFELYYQPIFTISRQLAGLEALSRFRKPSLRDISPAEFIPVAEHAGPITAINEWVMREACRQGHAWMQEGLPTVPIAVNVSAMQ